jgi:hypothetical protein
VVVGAGQFGQREGVEGIGLAAGGPKAGTGGLKLVGVDGQHDEAGFQQSLDQHALRPFDGHPLDAFAHQRAAKLGEPSLVVSEAYLEDLAPGLVEDAKRVLLFRPVDSPALLCTRRPPFWLVFVAARPQMSYRCGCS